MKIYIDFEDGKEGYITIDGPVSPFAPEVIAEQLGQMLNRYYGFNIQSRILYPNPLPPNQSKRRGKLKSQCLKENK